MHHPLALTSQEFSSLLSKESFTKPPLPLLLYKSFLRSGTIPTDIPAFRNAKVLFERLVAAIDQTIDPVSLVEKDERTVKFLLSTDDGHCIESVLIHQKGRTTLCLSSQLGCRMGCRFCKTGQSGFIRSLTTREIVQQAFVAIHTLKESIQNIVFMGMGEPFDNYDAVMQAVRVFTDPLGFGFAMRRITVSTSGIPEGILKLSSESEPSPYLAVSLGAPIQELRRSIMPNRIHLDDIHKAMETYCAKTKKQILLSYVLLKGINDSKETAETLIQFIKGLNVRINIIPYNAASDSQYERPLSSDIMTFVHTLRSCGIPVFIRQEHGTSIQAACGQLGRSK